jgi:hypothetical protein
MVAVGAETDVTVGSDDQKRDLADAQLVGCGWRQPCPRVPTAGSRREHDRRFDERAIVATTWLSFASNATRRDERLTSPPCQCR